MSKADKNVPVTENKKIYEKSVPVINACPKILMQTKTKYLRNGKISNAIISGRLASPIRKNGNGLGIMYSTAERKRQKAPSIARFLREMLPCDGVKFIILSTLYYQ